MSDPTPPSLQPPRPDEPPPAPPPVRHLEFKAAMLLVFMGLLIFGSVAYVLYARGAFEVTQELVLMSDDSEGVVVGMDLTFSGFPIGRVRAIELAEDGNARIIIDVPRKDAHWLRESSIFTMVRSIVGGTNIRAYSGMLTDKPLAAGAVRPVLKGDASAEIPKLMASAKEVLDNVGALTSREAALGAALTNVQALTEKLNGPGGALGVMLGNDADRKKLLDALDRTNTLLARLDSVASKADGLAAKADTQVFGAGGVMPETKAAIVQLNAILGDARTSLRKVDALLVDAQAIGANARVATEDLGALRGEVETNLRKVESLVNDINRRWPFARDTEIKLP
ncbi:MAG: MCE family protein [Comamonadaceae bacterium]|nr:MAG: MCE family protein [Comamonadaceae bacterium]